MKDIREKNLVALMLDTKEFSKKPSGKETAGIQTRLERTEIDLKSLAVGLCNGMTCKPAVLEGRKSNDWMQQQVFMLDFDHGTTIKEERIRCEKYGITPVFFYTSFSNTDLEHRFRMVFVTDNVIFNVEKRNRLQKALISMFAKSDNVTFDCTRIFYGGKGNTPLNVNYHARINADEIIELYYKENASINNIKPRKDKIERKNERKIENKNTIDNNIKAIKELNVIEMKRILSEGVLSASDKEDFKDLLLSLASKTPKQFKCVDDVYSYINSLDLHLYLGIGDEMVKCIFDDHNDNTPSAHIYRTYDGTHIYKCFGCNRAVTMISITEKLAKCKKKEAIEFIMSVYNLELILSDWENEKRHMMITNSEYLDSEEFKENYPELNKLIRTRKIHIQNMLMHFSEFVHEENQVDGEPIFFKSYKNLEPIMGINNNLRTVSQSLVLFALLGLMEKVNTINIPEKELKKAKHISAKYKYKKLTSFYKFEEFSNKVLTESEKIAKVLKENNISLKGLSREYVLRTFGVDKANLVYPQYVKETENGTSIKSNEITMKLSKKILEEINEKGYIFEKDIKTNKKLEMQWKRSIQEILDSYNLKKIRLNKQLKERFNITIEGYPFVIVYINDSGI